MSVVRTLLRFAREVRREAKRNPEFAARLDAVFRAHESGRDVPEELIEEVARDEEAAVEAAPPRAAPALAPDLNPVGLYARDGADGLKAALIDKALDAAALRALIAEHNLDPGGEAEDLDRTALVAHIVAHAEKRVLRDRKMFDY